MKLAIRVLVLCVVVAGAAAASTTSKAAPALPSRQSATDTLPNPYCSIHVCPIQWPATGIK